MVVLTDLRRRYCSCPVIERRGTGTLSEWDAQCHEIVLHLMTSLYTRPRKERLPPNYGA